MNRNDHESCDGILQWASDQHSFVELFNKSDSGISLMAAEAISALPSERVALFVSGRWMDAVVTHAATTATKTYLDLEWASSTETTALH